MSNELIIAILSIGFVGSLAAFFVMWSFYDGQKKLTQKERDRRWDEISLRQTIESEKDAEIEELQYEERDLQGTICMLECDKEQMAKDRDRLQDKLFALLCPRNDHVWKDGRCIKCGRCEEK